MQFIYKEYEDIDLEKDATTIYYNFEDELVMVYFQTLKDYQKDSSYVIKKELYKKFEPVLLI
jgi:glycyl-tRNA synthetase alpha subunit